MQAVDTSFTLDALATGQGGKLGAMALPPAEQQRMAELGLTAGTPVVITGTGFSGTPVVYFGSTPSTKNVFVSSTKVWCTSPAAAGAGTASVTVHDSGGISNGLTYTYGDSFPIFFEDFTSSPLNSSKWYPTTSGSLGKLAVASGSAVSVDPTGTGNLKITATHNSSGTPYTTGEIHSQAGFIFGKFECSAKMPPSATGGGIWPAFWLDSAEPSEMDIMEWISSSNAIDHATYHYHAGSSPQTGTSWNSGVDLSAAYHVYGFTWTANALTWTLDGTVIKSLSAAQVAALGSGAFIPTTGKQIILTLQMDDGSVWGPPGAPNPGTGAGYPVSYLVDWVRVSGPQVNPPPAAIWLGAPGNRYRLNS